MPPFKEALNWFQFAYTLEWMGAYVVLASIFLVHSAVVYWDELYPSFFTHLRKLYPEYYTPSTLGPGHDYSVALTGCLPERREYNCGEEGGDGLGNLINISFSGLGIADLGRIINIRPSAARMNNLSPNIDNTYFKKTPGGQTPEPR